MGHCMTVLIASFTSLLLFSIIPSINSLNCYHREFGPGACPGSNYCVYIEAGSATHVQCALVKRPVAPGCYNNGLQTNCYCNTDNCNEKKESFNLEDCKYLKGKDDEDFIKVQRIKEASKCYYKSFRNVETGGPVTEEKAGIMSNEKCNELGIQTCKKTFDDSKGQGPWTETVECCCEGANCNDKPKGISAVSEPLKCHSTDNKQFCHGQDALQNALCWYQAKMYANGNLTTEAANKCVDKSQCPNPNPDVGDKCKISMQDSDTVTVDCCCKEAECNTDEKMKNELVKIIPTKCYVYSNEEAKISKWCASNTCSYTLKKDLGSDDQISEEGSCKDSEEEECDLENPCTYEVNDEEGKAVITINCCCTKDNCNTQDSDALDQPIKDIKVPERDADKPQADGATALVLMSFFSQLLATTIIGVSVLIAAVQHLHIGI